jgi:hypothetical protein
MRKAKKMKSNDQEAKVLLDCPNNTDPSIPNAPFGSDNNHSEIDPSNDHLYLNENIYHVDLLESTINDLDDIPTVLTITQNLVNSLPHATHIQPFRSRRLSSSNEGPL